jgi:hypothetical protein
MELRCQLTERDMVAGGLACARRPGPMRTAFTTTLLAAALLGAALASIGGRLGWLTPWPYAIPREVLWGVLNAVVFAGLWWWNLWRRLRRGARSSAFGPTGPSRLWTDTQGIHDHALLTDVTTTYPWTLVDRVDQTREHAFVWVSQTKTVIIPRRVGEDAVAAFIAEVNRYRQR